MTRHQKIAKLFDEDFWVTQWRSQAIRFIRVQKITSVWRIPISMFSEKIICVHLTWFRRNVLRMENSFDSVYSCSKITSVWRIPISMSSEKIICVQMRNLWEINTKNNPCVKNFFFLFFICHSVILSCSTLIINKITCWQICKYLQYLSFICHNM